MSGFNSGQIVPYGSPEGGSAGALTLPGSRGALATGGNGSMTQSAYIGSMASSEPARGGASRSAADLEFEDEAVQDFINILEEHRRNCEKVGKYTEAEIARKRLDELRIHEENRRREALRAR